MPIHTVLARRSNTRMGEARTLDGSVGLQPDQAVDVAICLGMRMPTMRTEFRRNAPDALKYVGPRRCPAFGFDQ